jgi:hypothetical protein
MLRAAIKKETEPHINGWWYRAEKSEISNDCRHKKTIPQNPKTKTGEYKGIERREITTCRVRLIPPFSATPLYMCLYLFLQALRNHIRKDG